MKILGFLLLLCATLCAEDLTTVSGKKYLGVTVSKVEPDGLSISHDDGIAKVPFGDLSVDLQKKYGFDPAKAADYGVVVQKARAAQMAADAEGVKLGKIADAEKGLKETIRKSQVLVTAGRILQVLPGGARVNVEVTIPQSEKDFKEGRVVNGSLTGMRNIFIAGLGTKQGLVDGDPWDGGPIWLAGVRKYTSATGAATTVRRYALSEASAFRIQVDEALKGKLTE